MKFRWHRGGLQESMATVIDDTPENIKALVSKEYPDAKIASDYYCFDKRIEWNTYMITVNGQAVGYTDGNLCVE